MLPENKEVIFVGKDVTFLYLHTDDNLPLGNVGDPSTPAGAARTLLEEGFGEDYGPFIHLSPDHKEEKHNLVKVLSHVPSEHTTVCADAVIIPKDSRFAIETLISDFPAIMVECSHWLGFIHAGASEIVDGIVDQFFSAWPATHTAEPSQVVVGPMIGGNFYQAWPPEGFWRYKTTTLWGAPGLDLFKALRDQIGQYIPEDDIILSDIDPFQKVAYGVDKRWGSNQFYQVMKRDPNQAFSPRDCAVVFVDPI